MKINEIRSENNNNKKIKKHDESGIILEYKTQPSLARSCPLESDHGPLRSFYFLWSKSCDWMAVKCLNSWQTITRGPHLLIYSFLIRNIYAADDDDDYYYYYYFLSFILLKKCFIFLCVFGIPECSVLTYAIVMLIPYLPFSHRP